VNTGPSIWLKFALEPSAELNLVTDDILAGSLRGDCYDHAQLLRGLHAVGVLAPDQLRKAWRNIGLKAKCVEYPSGEGNFRVSPLYWFINVRRDIRFRRAEEMAFFRMGIEGQKSCMLNMGGPGCERVKSFYDSLSVIMGDQIVWPLPYIMERSK
jgi:hypothetical protein